MEELKPIGKIQREFLLSLAENCLIGAFGVENFFDLEKNGRKLEIIKEIYSTMAEFKKVEKPDLPADTVKVGYKTSYSKKWSMQTYICFHWFLEIGIQYTTMKIMLQKQSLREGSFTEC